MTDFSHAGTVSHGTLRAADLIPVFYRALLDISPERAYAVRSERPQIPIEDSRALERIYADNEDSGLLDLLFEALDDIAPEGWYFGAHPDDGADFGFWEVES